jgi:hypothetical protein
MAPGHDVTAEQVFTRAMLSVPAFRLLFTT